MAGTAQDQSLTFQYTLASQLHVRTGSNASYDWLPVVASTAYVPDGLNRYSTVAGATYAYDSRHAGIELAHRIRKQQFSFGRSRYRNFGSLKQIWDRALA